MKSILKALAWTSFGGLLGVGATFSLREATRTPIPSLGALAAPTLEAPPPPEPEPEAPPPETLPVPPAPAGSPEPPPRPPAFHYFGFEVSTPAAASPPPPPPPPAPPPAPVAPALLRFAPAVDRCAAGFDATSTLHDFRGWTKAVAGWVRFEKGRLEETAEAEFTVDARTLDTNNPDRDREMHADFLQSAQFPAFKFRLAEFRRMSKDRDDGAFSMKGTLEIHGKSKEVEIPGLFVLRRDGWLHVKGELRAKMSDFGISPPVTALVIRVDDEIKIWFELWARRQEEKP